MTATAVSCAAVFADAVRRRVAARAGGRIGRRIDRRGAWPTGRSWGVGQTGASTVERVLRSGVRTWPQRPAASGRIDVRIALALRLAGEAAAIGGGVRPRPLEVMPLRRGIPLQPVLGTRERPANTTPAATALRWAVEAGRGASDGNAAGRRERTASAPPSLVLRHAGRTIGGGAPDRSGASTPPPVALVHRTAPAPLPPSGSPTDRATVAASVRWHDSAPETAAPLTSADLPHVIERVVGEIDRRVTAARERRGWTA